ncbi:MAG: ATP-binding protein [Candidatus Thiothrix putei]|uniref:histidine kinase n=1 Tax=Candidatus Thiothrix putei TaxID=3080811 RepID=A0AA95KII0_9GAMM|nr:MAG: ATP-binding protein [Candidatus Thiothrix putei]
MSTTLELVSVQYALALLVGQSLDLRTMLHQFLPPALKLLNCRSGYLWLRRCESFDTIAGIEPCYSYPKLKIPLVDKSATLAAAIQALADNAWLLAEPLDIVETDGSYCHVLPIGQSGLLVLRRDPPLLAAQLQALTPVLMRLETACLACVQHANLEAARQEAERANQAKNAFLAMISHEIRTPMNSVMGLTDLLGYSELTPAQREYVKLIRESSGALLGIINEILDFSRIESGATRLNNAPFRVQALLETALAPLAVAARDKAIAFHWRIAADVPETLQGDAGRLRQVLINLVGNALKFTNSGGEIAIEITAEPHAPTGSTRVRFSVRDTGIGIASEQLETIFQPFQQVDSRISRRYGGTGLGLTIAAQLVAMMGGKLQVESQLAQGSTFHFTLLLPTDVTPAPATPVGDVLSMAQRPLTILLAEDNEINGMFTRLLLNKIGHQVTVVVNGREALESWQQQRPDVILMDMQMPVMDGMEATLLIRAQEQITGTHTPIIALTANVLASDRERCLQAGMDDFLSKPFELPALLDVLARATAR